MDESIDFNTVPASIQQAFLPLIEQTAIMLQSVYVARHEAIVLNGISKVVRRDVLCHRFAVGEVHDVGSALSHPVCALRLAATRITLARRRAT